MNIEGVFGELITNPSMIVGMISILNANISGGRQLDRKLTLDTKLQKEESKREWFEILSDTGFGDHPQLVLKHLEARTFLVCCAE